MGMPTMRSEQSRAWRSFPAITGVHGLQKGKVYVLYKVVEAYLDGSSEEEGHTIYDIRTQIVPNGPSLRLVYQYVKELAQEGLLTNTWGKVGQRHARYIPTKAGIRCYYFLKEEIEREKDPRIIPRRDVLWNVAIMNSVNPRLKVRNRELLYDLLVHYEHQTILTDNLLKFICARKESDFDRYLFEREDVEFVWRIPERDYLPSSSTDKLFILSNVEIIAPNGERIKLKREDSSASDGQLTLVYTHPKLQELSESSKHVRTSYDFRTVLPKNSHQFFLKFDRTTNGFEIHFDYREADFSDIFIVHYFGPGVIPDITLDKSRRLVDIKVDGSIDIRRGEGVAIVWT